MLRRQITAAGAAQLHLAGWVAIQVRADLVAQMAGHLERKAAGAGAAWVPADMAAVGSVEVVPVAADSAARVSELALDSRFSGGWSMFRMKREQQNVVFGLQAILVALVLCLVAGTIISCGHEAEKRKEAGTSPVSFATPEEAGSAFLAAAKSGDQDSLLAIFGPDGKAALFSGDAVKDKDNFQDFVAGYNQMHRWREIKVGGQVLYVGADNYPFPIPLAKNSAGQWVFDTAAGKDEILARRIGKDELTTIAASGAVAEAQSRYFAKMKQYAQKFISDEGKQNGLYWPVTAGQSPSPLNDLRDFAVAAGYTNAGDKAQAFGGYYFKILTQQGARAKGGAKDYIADGRMTGGFALIAYPVEYRNSGIMTFIVGKDGIVYQKDLGEKTVEVASAVSEYDVDESWRPAL